MAISFNDLQFSKRMTWENLRKAQYAYTLPFRIYLPDNQVVTIEKVIRFVPKRRLIAFGAWQGKPVVVKLFFKVGHHAKRHMDRDVAGIKLLQKYNIKTPALYYQGISDDKKVQVLLFKRLVNAKNVEEIWKATSKPEDILPLAKSIINMLAKNHQQGILQHDSNLRNYLVADDALHMIDGAEIKFFADKDGVPKPDILENLALLFSQFGDTMKEYHRTLFQYYVQARGWKYADADMHALSLIIKRKTTKRWLRIKKKIFNESSSYSRYVKFNAFGMIDRNNATYALMNFLNQIDAITKSALATCLRRNPTVTQHKVTLDKRDFIVLSFAVKNKWDPIRRMMGPSAARHAWQLTIKLASFGILTPKPIAFIEKKLLGVRRHSFYIHEHVAGETVASLLKIHRNNEEKKHAMITRVSTLLKNLYNLNIAYRNISMEDFLVNQREQLLVTNLADAKEYKSTKQLKQAWQKSLKKLIARTSDIPLLQKSLQKMLQDL